MSTIEEAREQARAAQEQISNRLIGGRLGLSSTREMDKDMLALSNGLDAISALLDATEPPSEDMGPAASCHLCVGAGGYEDYDGGWVGCSCQRTREPMRDADGDMISSGEHRKISMSGDSFFVCDTCTNVLGLNVRWDHASKREDHQAAVESLPDKPAEDEREALVMTLYANGMAGNLHEPLRRQAVQKWADAILAAGYSKGPRPITDEMVEAAAREYHERGNGEGSFARMSGHVRTSLLFRMKCALRAAEGARR